MSREEALDIIYKGIFDTISSGYNAAMDRKRQKAFRGFQDAKRRMALYGYQDPETPEASTEDVVSAPRVATPTMPSLPPPPPQDAEFEEVRSEPSPITDERRMLPYTEPTPPPPTPPKPKQLPPPKDMYEDTTGGPIEADEMKEMAESKKDSDPAHDKAFKQSYERMIGEDDGYYAALNRALGQSKRAENRAIKDADKETKAGYSKDMAEAVRYFNAKKKGQNKAAKTEIDNQEYEELTRRFPTQKTPKIKPAVKPETAKKGANKTKPAPVEKPKAASKKGQEALATRSAELTKPKADDGKMKYAEYTKNIQNKNTRDEWVKENMDRIKDAGFYDVLPDRYKTGNEEPKKATKKKKTKRDSDDEAKRAMGL